MGVTFIEPVEHVCQIGEMEAQKVCGFRFNMDPFLMKIIGNRMFIVLLALIEHGNLVSRFYATSL